MRQKFIKKLILGTMISTTLCTLVPVKASADWVNDYQNNWYYSQNNQNMTGWKKIDGQLYYFDENGKMQTGWIKAGDLWYFLQSNGAVKTGWINYNKNLYYADSSGVMQTGTINIAGKVYMLGDNGVAKTSNTVVNGQFYTIGSDGEVVGMKVPTPDKEFDSIGKLVTVLKNTDNNVITTSPTDSKFNEVIQDQSQSDDDPNEGRTFKVRFKDSNGAELKTKSVKNGKTVDLYEPTKDGYVFAGWDTKSDGSGKSYDESDSIKVKEDISLYAQWTEDTAIYVEGITVKGSSYVTLNSTTQMTAEVSPSGASNANVTWSVSSGTGKATIDSNGVLTGVTNGTVTVKATSKDGSNVSGMKEVTVSATEVIVPVSQISVTSSTGISTITANGGTLQMKASVLPTDANNQDVTWSIEDRTGSASIDPSTGLVTAKSNGTVTVKATAADGSGIVGSTTITISGQLIKIPVESITVNGKDNATTINTDAALGGTSGTLQMNTSILPTTASNKAVTWSVDDTTKAKISTTGLVTAVTDGTVIVKATANDGSGQFGTAEITITNQSIKVAVITVSGADITTDGGTSQMSTTVTPDIATNKDVTWSVENETGSATINSTGELKAISNGKVIVKATATDGSKVVGTKEITLTAQTTIIPVASIAVSGTNNGSAITADNGTLQMIATVSPASTTSQAVTWSVSSGTGTATIDKDTGLLTAVTNGTVTVEATSVAYPQIIGSKNITLSGQFVETNTITVSAPVDTIEVDGTVQMSATILPTNVTKKSVTWSVNSQTGSATITSAGVLTGKSVGVVNVKATATDGTGVVGSETITIIPQIKVTDVLVKGFAITGGVIGTVETNEIITDKGSLQMQPIIGPTDATNQAVTWSVEKVGDAGTTMTGNATISSTGLLTAVANGTVTVKATAQDSSGIVGMSEVITISNQVIKATEYTVKGFPITNGIPGATETTQITADKGTLQMQATVLPMNATTTPAAVIWSVEQAGDAGTTMTGKATIDSSTGILTASGNGTVKVKATGTTTEGIVINGTEVIAISGQIVPVTGIKITTTITTVGLNKTLPMLATIQPTTATNKGIKWQVTNIDGTVTSNAVIDPSGLLTGLVAGTTVKVTAVCTADPTIFDYKYITIS